MMGTPSCPSGRGATAESAAAERTARERTVRGRGAVLPVVVLMTLALLGLAHGLLVSAEGAYIASRAYARMVTLDSWVGGVMEAELGRGWESWMDSVALGEAWMDRYELPGELQTTVTWRRLAAESWLVEVRVTPAVGGPVGRRRLAWRYEPATRVSALPAVVSVGPDASVTVSGTVTSDGVPVVGVVAEPTLGLLPLARVLAASDPVGPSGTPGPVEVGGTCDTGQPWNWGDPMRPYRPCGDHLPLKGRAGPVVVNGGEGQGVLVVDGDVTLAGGALFHGMVLASGRVDVLDASVVEGRIVAFGGFGVGPGSLVVGSPERAEAALEAVRARLGSAILLHPAVRLGPE